MKKKEEDPECQNLQVDYTYFERCIWESMAFRCPAFEAIKVGNAWAGL